MNKIELIEIIATEANISKATAKEVLNSTFEIITNALSKGEKVTLVGFGTFSVSQRAARKGRNPKTGEVINIAAKKVAKFKAGSELSTSVK